jgi:hypothetical protein
VTVTASFQFARLIAPEDIQTGHLIAVDGDEWIALEDAVISPLVPGESPTVTVEVNQWPVRNQAFRYTLTLLLSEHIEHVSLL